MNFQREWHIMRAWTTVQNLQWIDSSPRGHRGYSELSWKISQWHFCNITCILDGLPNCSKQNLGGKLYKVVRFFFQTSLFWTHHCALTTRTINSRARLFKVKWILMSHWGLRWRPQICNSTARKHLDRDSNSLILRGVIDDISSMTINSRLNEHMHHLRPAEKLL